MGFNLKNVFKENEEELVINRSNKAIKALIFMAAAVVCIIVIAVIIKFSGDKDGVRRNNIIHDIKSVQDAVKLKANDYRTNQTTTSLIGTSLENNPVVLSVNGMEEEYRYGYYWITPENLSQLTSATLLTDEYYIVNYDTYDVINYNGIVYNKMKYHSIEDILLVEKGMFPASKQIIRTVADLEKIRQNPNGYFKLSSNLDLSEFSNGEGFRPIQQFSGTLDGRGYTISNLKIHRPSSNNVGFFGELTSSANVTNIKFEKVSITGGQFVGTLSGIGAGNISHITVIDGSVSGQTNYTGGLVGSQNNGTISNCIVTLNSVKGTASVGGMVGMLYSGNLTKSGATTSVTGAENIGGLIGNIAINSVDSAVYVQEVASNVQLTGNNDLGGLIGKITTLASGKIQLKNSYSKGVISGQNKNTGGFVGSISSVGAANIEFNSLYTTLDILEKVVTSGGCIGYTDIAITSAVSFSDCFWEKDLAPGEVLRDVGARASNTFALSFDSKTYNEMRIRNTFANWDLDIWGFNERNSTPYLKWEI